MASRLNARRQQILDLLAQSPICSPIQLSDATKVSSETIRKDLDALANEGLIIKVHGGVALAATNANEIPFDLRATRHAQEKKLIAHAAVQLISSGDAIVFEGCTTNLELARALTATPEMLETLVVITNSLAIASLFDSGRKCRRFFFLGGWINADQYNAHGNHTANALKDFHVNKAFISGAALSENYILSAYYEDDALFQKAAIQAAKQTILMVDHSKFGEAAILSVATLSEVDYLVTNKQLSPQEKNELSTIGVHLIQA